MSFSAIAAASTLYAPPPDQSGSGDIIDPLTLSMLQSQLRELSGKAREIEEQARRLYEIGGGDDLLMEACEAQAQAGFIRNTVEQASAEINSAPTAHNGQKKLPSGRVAVLGSHLQHVAHVADLEKLSLVGAISEAVAHHEKAKSEPVKSKSRNGSCRVKEIIRKAVPAAPAVTSVALTSIPHGLHSALWMERGRESAYSLAGQAEKTMHNIWSRSGELLHEGAEYISESAPATAVSAFASNAWERTKQGAYSAGDIAYGYTVVPLFSAARTIAQEAAAAYEATASAAGNAITQTADAINASYAEKKAWLAEVAENEGISPMTRALQQAATLLPALPASLAAGVSSLGDIFDISSQNLPRISDIAGHFTALY